MRSDRTWRRRFVALLRGEYTPTGDQPSAAAVLELELSLYLLETVAHGQSVRAVPALLDGYGAATAVAAQPPLADTPARLANGRTLLWRRQRPFGWDALLRSYFTVPDHVRGYDITQDGVPRRRPCRVAPQRWDIYEEMITGPLPFDAALHTIAGPGRYRMSSTARGAGIDLPEDVPRSAVGTQHDVGVRERRPVTVTWAELLRTAQEMDLADGNTGRNHKWADRMREATLQLRTQDDSFDDATTLTVDGMLHMVGLVSVGKSTLVMVLSVWAAQRGRTATLVVGDNSTALRIVDTLSRYREVRAAPVLGANRARHADRLHRLQPPPAGRLVPADPFGFEFVSTACALDSLRPDAARPLGIREAPCQDLVAHDPDNATGAWRDKPRRTCPLWHGCQRHEAARRLVEANIWVATPWSLVHTRLPSPLSGQRMRYLEAAWRRSDLIVVDEADQVQANLDEMFANAQVLLGPSDEAWIDEIGARVEEKLRVSGRAQNASHEVRRFSRAVQHARTAATIIYQILQRDRVRRGNPVLKTIDKDYFTAWALFDQLAQDWAGHRTGPRRRPADGWEEDPLYRTLRDCFNAVIDDPTGAPEGLAGELVALVRNQLTDTEEDRQDLRLRQWLTDLAKREVVPGRTPSLAEVETEAWRLELAIAVAVMAHRLNLLLALWPQAAAELDMHDSLTAELRRPPTDLMSAVPDSPMGNVLGFQYVEDEPAGPAGGLGQFRFFRYSGVGRILLTGLPGLFPADGPGPNVLLLSGTSWAGTSPRYHIDVPVGAILRPSPDKLDEIARTTFALDIQTTGERSTPIWVSGRYGAERDAALRAMVTALTRPGPGPGRLSRLERERAALPRNRRKIMLLVGSYAEARLVTDALVRAKPSWSDQVRCLIGDDELESGWENTHLLRRADVARFGGEDAGWILVAPILAVERGHNILNEDGVAALGAAFFLVRPHPRPRDLSYVTQRINQYAQHQMRDWRLEPSAPHERLATAGITRRRDAQRQWRRLLHSRVVYSQLDGDERRRVAWTQLVTIWQVVGRLLRGGQAAKVYFCDAAFAPNTAQAEQGLLDDAGTSLLHGMREVLLPYFDPASTDPDRHLVRALYRPLHDALTAMGP